MTIRLDRFGSVTLPNYNPQARFSTAKAKIALVDVPGDGSFDVWGANPAPGAEFSLTKRCTLHEDSPSDLQTALDATKALFGTRAKLYTKNLANGSERWAYARCEQVREGKRTLLTQDVEIDFLINPPIWYDDSELSLSHVLLLATGTDVITLANNGNKIIDDMRIEIFAGLDAPITEVFIRKYAGATTYGHISYDGTIAIGKTLVIDCGAASVLNDGVNDYDHLHIETDHRNERWIRLNVGDNLIEVKRTGGSVSSSFTASYLSQWW